MDATTKHTKGTAASRLYWSVVGAAEAGAGHVSQGKGCEDSYVAATCREALVLAVADGAGSAPRAAEGSSLALQAALRALESIEALPEDEAGWHETFKTVLWEVRGALERAAGEGLAADFATTLLLAVVTEGWLAALQIGDGAIVAEQEDIVALTLPQRGTHAGETVFVTSEDAAAAAQVVVRPNDGVKGLALFTDGLEALALRLAEGKAHLPFFKPLFAFVKNNLTIWERAQALNDFLASERVAERSDDDKTLLVAARL